MEEFFLTAINHKNEITNSNTNIFEELTLSDIIPPGLKPELEKVLIEYPLVNTLKFKSNGNIVVIDPIKRTRFHHLDEQLFKKRNICISDTTYDEIVKILDNWVISILPNYARDLIYTDYIVKSSNISESLSNNKNDLSKISKNEHVKLGNRKDYITNFFINSCKQNNNTIEGILHNYISIYHFMITRDSIHEFLLNPDQTSDKLYKKQPPTERKDQDKLLLFNIDYNNELYPIIYIPASDSLNIVVDNKQEVSDELVKHIKIFFDKDTKVLNIAIPSIKNSPMDNAVMYISRIIIGVVEVLLGIDKQTTMKIIIILNKLGNGNIKNIKSIYDTQNLKDNHKDSIINTIKDIIIQYPIISILGRLNERIFKVENNTYIKLSLNFKKIVSNIIVNAVRKSDKLINKSIMF